MMIDRLKSYRIHNQSEYKIINKIIKKYNDNGYLLLKYKIIHVNYSDHILTLHFRKEE